MALSFRFQFVKSQPFPSSYSLKFSEQSDKDTKDDTQKVSNLFDDGQSGHISLRNPRRVAKANNFPSRALHVRGPFLPSVRVPPDLPYPNFDKRRRSPDSLSPPSPPPSEPLICVMNLQRLGETISGAGYMGDDRARRHGRRRRGLPRRILRNHD